MKRRRAFAALIAALAVISGCDSCAPPPTRPPPLDPRANATVVDPPSDAVFDKAWQKRMAALSMKGRVAVERPVRYVVPPGCSLQYQLRAKRSSEVATDRPATSDGMDAEVLFEVQGRSYRVHLGKRVATFTSDGVARKQQSDAGMPTAEIETDGQRWSEVGGPSTLWAAHSSVPALTTMFAPIPGKPASGSSIKWDIETYPVRVTTALPRARHKAGGKGVPDPLPAVDGANVTVLRYLSLTAVASSASDGGAGASGDAVLLEARWTVVDERSEPTLSQQRESWRGRYLVSTTGRLIHALLMANVSSWWSLQPGESSVKRGAAERELRLVRACDGIVLPAL
jgi:hypothetical protein